MHFEFFASQETNAFFPWPSLNICQGEHEDSGEPAAVWCVELAWIVWHVGFFIEFE